MISYSHHVPGLEKDDDAFFDLAAGAGLEIVNMVTVVGKHMWRKDDDVDIYIVELLCTLK